MPCEECQKFLSLDYICDLFQIHFLVAQEKCRVSLPGGNWGLYNFEFIDKLEKDASYKTYLHIFWFNRQCSTF